MRPRTLLLLVLALGLLAFAACSNEGDKGNPETSASPGANPSLSPSVEATPAPDTAGSCQPSTSGQLEATISHGAFDRSCLAVVADEPFTVTFSIQDKGFTCNFSIYDQNDIALYSSDYFTGPTERTLQVKKGIPSGTYTFMCDTTPTIQGIFVSR
jgi:hypothetical protein